MAVTERVIGWKRRPLRPVPLLAEHPVLRSGAPLFAWDAADGLLDQFGRLLAPAGTADTRESGDGPETFASGAGNRIGVPFNFSPPTVACTCILVFRPQTSSEVFQSHTGNNYAGIRVAVSASNQLVFEFGDGAGVGSSNRRTHVVTDALTPGQQTVVVISFSTITSGYFIVDGASRAYTNSGTATGYSAGTTNGVLHAAYRSGAYINSTNASGISSLIVLPYFVDQGQGQSLGDNPWQLLARSEEHVYNYSGVPEISSIAADTNSISVEWSGLADEYRINGGAATALPDGTSPDTITGLTENTPYNAPGLQLRYQGGAWSAAVPFGTANPGEGGGGFVNTDSATLDAGYSVVAPSAAVLDVGFAVLAAGTAVLDVGFAVGTTGSATLASGYSVAAPGTAVLDAGFPIQSSGSQNLSTGYPVRDAGAATLSAGYEVISEIASGSATLASGYAVTARESATLSSGYPVATSGAQSLLAGFPVAAAGSASLPVGFEVASAVSTGSTTLSSGYAVGARSAAVLSVGYTVEGEFTVSTDLVMTVRATVSIGTHVERPTSDLTMRLRKSLTVQ